MSPQAGISAREARRPLNEVLSLLDQRQRDKLKLQSEQSAAVSAVRRQTQKVAEVEQSIKKASRMNWIQLKLSGLKQDKLRWDLEREQRSLQEASMAAREASEKTASVERDIQRLKREAESHNPAPSAPQRREA